MLSHQLKGSGGNISANSLSSEAARMEKAAKEKDVEAIQKAWPSLQEALEEIVLCLGRFNQKELEITQEKAQINSDKPLISTAVLRLKMQEFITAITSDLSIAQSLMAELKQCALAPPFAQQVEAIVQDLDNFDIDEAKQKGEGLLATLKD